MIIIIGLNIHELGVEETIFTKNPIIGLTKINVIKFFLNISTRILYLAKWRVIAMSTIKKYVINI